MDNSSCLFVLKSATYIGKLKMPVFLFSDLRFRIENTMNRRYTDPPLQNKPLSFTCSYGLTYELKFNDHNLLYWIK